MKNLKTPISVIKLILNNPVLHSRLGTKCSTSLNPHSSGIVIFIFHEQQVMLPVSGRNKIKPLVFQVSLKIPVMHLLSRRYRLFPQNKVLNYVEGISLRKASK